MWLMGNTESFRSVADRFGESRGSLHLYITQVVEAFQTIGTNYIKWPDTEMDLRSVSDEFEKNAGRRRMCGWDIRANDWQVR